MVMAAERASVRVSVRFIGDELQPATNMPSILV